MIKMGVMKIKKLTQEKERNLQDSKDSKLNQKKDAY